MQIYFNFISYLPVNENWLNQYVINLEIKIDSITFDFIQNNIQTRIDRLLPAINQFKV